MRSTPPSSQREKKHESHRTLAVRARTSRNGWRWHQWCTCIGLSRCQYRHGHRYRKSPWKPQGWRCCGLISSWSSWRSNFSPPSPPSTKNLFGPLPATCFSSLLLWACCIHWPVGCWTRCWLVGNGLSSVTVVLNSLRLRTTNLRTIKDWYEFALNLFDWFDNGGLACVAVQGGLLTSYDCQPSCWIANKAKKITLAGVEFASDDLSPSQCFDRKTFIPCSAGIVS